MKENTLLIKKFLTKKECKGIIEKYAVNLPKMSVLGSDNKDNFRVAEGTWIPKDSNNTVIEKFKNKVAEITGLPEEHQELPHLVRYVVGGEYKPHQDFFWPGTNYYDSSMKEGGNRAFSCLLYLNDDFEGGQTDFPTWKLTVIPQTGSIISWRNMKENGELEKDSLHAGLPVTKGVKYILIVWVREHAYKVIR